MRRLYLVDFVEHVLAGDAMKRIAAGKRSVDDVDTLLLFAAAKQNLSWSSELLDQPCVATDAATGVRSTVACTVFDYATFANRSLEQTAAAYSVLSADSGASDSFDTPIPCATPAWDNTARYPEGGSSLAILKDSTPAKFEDWVSRMVAGGDADLSRPRPRFVAINAINEWGEGCHLEPDTRDGMSYYKALQTGLRAHAHTHY